MAHLSDDALPPEFDVVVEGTGLIQSILAAALARCEKRVLHLDRNGFYGDLWGSLMQKEFDEWLQNNIESHDEPALPVTICDEGVLTIAPPLNKIYNIVQTVHGSNRTYLEDSHADAGSNTSELQTNQLNAASPQTPLLNRSSLGPLKTRMVYDIFPKVLACRGLLVDVLTKSGCSRYVEFKAISKICVYQSGKVEQVPCSRADVFESKLVSMLEKRKMMKFLSFCTNFEANLNTHELENMTFLEYLRTTDLTENLIQYVLLCIAMTDGDTTALEGLQASKLFLNSLGRFDNAPFLYPIFGGGEIPQAFCRYCAVFGGVYCLRCSVEALFLSGSTISAIKCSNGQKIACKAMVSSISAMSNTFDVCQNTRLSRAILLVDGPMDNAERSQLLLTIPPFAVGKEQSCVIRVLQVDSSTKTAVEGTYIVHLVCQSKAPTAKQDLEGAVRLLYNIQDDSECNGSGPRVLWSLYFNLDGTMKQKDPQSPIQLPPNLHLVSDLDSTPTYENAVLEAKTLFEILCPGGDFLQPPPENV